VRAAIALAIEIASSRPSMAIASALPESPRTFIQSTDGGLNDGSELGMLPITLTWL
jgi:hypothetical protein